ncbi:hypothetical protein BDF19DRAFT_150762 [Syncephalis fuscata]|nr:hypothetical protein BDF19DRAFT_150762 [Syncephalis fuscata]
MIGEETIGNNVTNYSQWSLITITGVIGVFALAHLARFVQTKTRAHIFLSIFLIILAIQFGLAIRGINADYLSSVAEIFSRIVATMLVAIWATSMRDKISVSHMQLARRVAYSWLLLYLIAAGITLAVAIYTVATDALPLSISILWLVALGIALLGDFSLILLTLWLHIRMKSGEFLGRRVKRMQLLRLSALFTLLIISKFGGLFSITILELVPYLIFHLMLLVTENAISGYELEPSDLAEKSIVPQNTYSKERASTEQA